MAIAQYLTNFFIQNSITAMSTNYDPNNWGQDEKYYSISSTAASNLQHGLEPTKLDVSSQTTKNLVFHLGQNKYSSLVGFDSQKKIHALFAPKTSPPGEENPKVIIGNLSDKKSQVMLGIVNTDAIGKVPLIIKYEDIPETLRGNVPIPASALKGTPLEVNDKDKISSDYGIVYVPNVAGLHPGMKIPAGVINSERVTTPLAFNSAAYSEWLELVKILAKQGDDFSATTSLIHETLAEDPNSAKYVMGNFVEGEDKVIFSHIFSTSFISDEEEKDHSHVLNELKSIFKLNPTPSRQDHHQPRTGQDGNVNNIGSVNEDLSKLLQGLNQIVEGSIAKKEQDEKYNEDLALARLKLLGLALDFDYASATVTNPRLTNFSPIMSNILSSKESKAIKTERLGLAAKKVFTFTSTDRQKQQNMLYLLRSLKVFSRAFLQAHLDGRVSSEDILDISKSTTALTVASYLPHNDNKAVAKAIQEDEAHRNESRLEVAETQRSGQVTSIKNLGKIHESKDADKVFANAINMMMLMYNTSAGNTGLIELLEHALFFLTTPEVSAWEKSGDENQHFTYTKLEIASQIIKAVGSFTEDINNIDVIENNKPLNNLDFEPLIKLLKSLYLTYNEIDVSVSRGTALKTVSKLTPDDKNPLIIEKKALLAQVASISTDGGSSNTRQARATRQATQSPPSNSPTTKHRDKRMKNHDDESNDVADKPKANKFKRNEERRKKAGLLIPAQGVKPAHCLPGSLQGKKPCAFFISIGYDCGKGHLCNFAHPQKHTDFLNGELEKILEHINEKKCAKVSNNWLKKNSDYKLPDKFEHLVDSTS